jgi:hypothetical protein
VAALIKIPGEFGGSWSTFCQEWCPEGSLGYSAEEVSLGLCTLKRLWPEKLAENIARGGRGTWTPTISVETGLLLAASETAKYFGGVRDRLIRGQRSAYSELVVGWALRKLLYEPQFEAGEGEPDLLCEVESVLVAFEVYAPDDSYASQKQRALVDKLRQAVSDAISNSRVEIGVLEDFSESQIPMAVQTILESPSQDWIPIDDWARFRRTDEGQRLPPSFDGDGAQITVAGDSDIKGPGKSAVIRWENVDTRAQHALERKRGQVRDGVGNIVVMDVCAAGGVREWPEVIARLPGADFAKIGAVVFFDQGCLGPPERMRRRWRVVTNPSAFVHPPESLLSGLESLDESTNYGLARKSRLSMS